MMQVTIVNDRSRPSCDADCGTDWSSAEAMTLARERIKERFGAQIELNFLDLASAESDPAALEEPARPKKRWPSVPLLLINGYPRITGVFDLRQLLDAIEAEMEMPSKNEHQG